MKKRTFIERATEALKAIGAVEDTSSHRGLVIHTIYGPLRIYPYDTAIRTCFAIIPRWPPAGAELNPYSGKWNFEFGNKPSAANLDYAIQSIKAICLPTIEDVAANPENMSNRIRQLTEALAECCQALRLAESALAARLTSSSALQDVRAALARVKAIEGE